jgi:hypothetical protein
LTGLGSNKGARLLSGVLCLGYAALLLFSSHGFSERGWVPVLEAFPLVLLLALAIRPTRPGLGLTVGLLGSLGAIQAYVALRVGFFFARAIAESIF